MRRPRVAAVSVDLDGIDAYRGLHDLAPRQRGQHAVADVALSRAMEFARAHALPLTLFAIGRDLERDRTAEQLQRAARAGARVENHSWSHRYDLSRASRGVIDDELERASAIIATVTGRRPRGFRAPGYVLSSSLEDGVCASDMTFDASSFPCPAYYLTKLLAVAAIRLRGRRSEAIVADPRSQLEARQPHRRRGLVEIPMAVTRRLRLPVIGTSIVLAGASGARALIRGCIGDPVISLELHGVDFLDAHDALEDLAAFQWDLRIPLARKRSALSAVIRALVAANYRFVPLDAVGTEVP